MKLRQLYTESIKDMPEAIQEALVNEAPHTRFEKSTIPTSLKFLSGAFVDLGFENLGLSVSDFSRIMRAFSGHGVRLPSPNAQLRIRHSRQGLAVVELADGSEEVSLPSHWAEGVLSIDVDDELLWVGKRVRREQLPENWDRSAYVEVVEGWQRKPASPAGSPSVLRK